MKPATYAKRKLAKSTKPEAKEPTRSVIVRIPESVLAEFEKRALEDKGLSAGLMVRTMIYDYNKGERNA